MNGTYPDSCCTVKYPDCGRQAHRTLGSDFANTVYERIHAQGCITAVKEVLEVSVNPILLAWGVIGVILALTELGVVFMCLLFILHSRRSEKLQSNTPRPQLEGKLYLLSQILIFYFCVHFHFSQTIL